MSDRTPRGRSDDWTETVVDKLCQVGEIARAVKAAAVLDGGDFFNDKNPDHNSHDLVRRTAKVHRSYPCPVYANVGNHDVRYGSLTHLDESPLSVCFESGIFRPCYGPHEAVLTDTDGTTVRVVGRPYQGARFDPFSLRVDPGPEDHLVVMLHQLASADPSLTFFPGEDVVPYSLFPSLFPSASIVCVGHWHKDQGVREFAPGRWVVNIGSLTRGTLAEDDVNRIPQVAELRLVKGALASVRTIAIDVGSPAEVFKDRQEVADRTTVDVTCLAQVATAVAEEGRTQTLEDLVRSLPNVSPEARERVLDVFKRSESARLHP